MFQREVKQRCLFSTYTSLCFENSLSDKVEDAFSSLGGTDVHSEADTVLLFMLNFLMVWNANSSQAVGSRRASQATVIVADCHSGSPRDPHFLVFMPCADPVTPFNQKDVMEAVLCPFQS